MSNTITTPVTHKLARTNQDRRIAGVCGGIAAYFGIDSLLVRLGYLALLAAGIGWVLYPLLWMLMPSDTTGNASFGAAFDDMRTTAQQGASQVRARWQQHRAKAARFDPYTGQPIKAAGEARFDPMTGQPLPTQPAPANLVSASPEQLANRRRRAIGFGLVTFGVLMALPLVATLLQFTWPLLLLGAGVMVLKRPTTA